MTKFKEMRVDPLQLMRAVLLGVYLNEMVKIFQNHDGEELDEFLNYLLQ